MDFPLWGDESLVSANLLTRGYLQLTEPLAHGQVAPVGFLWVERLAITTFGFHEWSLRLQGLVFAILSVLVFARAARLFLDENGAWWSIAVFSVSYFGIRYAAETKPYAGDLFFATLLLACAGEWMASRNPKWLWTTACVTPIALLFSFPAVFAAGGICGGLFPEMWKRRREFKEQRSVLSGYVAMCVVLGVSFLLLQWLVLSKQYQKSEDFMTNYWKAGFPPGPEEPWKFAKWLAMTLTSGTFAVPFGGENGGSVLSSICFAIGIGGWIRRKQWTVLSITGATFGLAFIAAAMRRYPLGDHPRLVQYLVPCIALGVGQGLREMYGTVNGWWSGWTIERSRRWGWVALGIIGLSIVVRDVKKPYQIKNDEIHRAFATWFWNGNPREELICLANNFPTPVYVEPHRAAYECYRALSLPTKFRTRFYRDVAALPDKRLKCVAYHLDEKGNTEGKGFQQEVYDDWQSRMAERFRFVSRTVERVDLGGESQATACYEIFEFEPK